jgi:methyl-accepting chemotaxis protein
VTRLEDLYIKIMSMEQCVQARILREVFLLMKSIGVRIGLIIVAIIVAFVSVTGFVSYRISKSVLKQKVTEAYLTTAEQTSEKLDFLYKSYDLLSSQMMVDQELQTTITSLFQGQSDDYDSVLLSDRLDTRLQSYMYSDPNIISIEVLKMDGSYFPTKSGLLTNKNYAQEPWFSDIQKQDGQSAWLGSNLADNRNKNPTVTLGRVIHGQGLSEGYCVILIDIDLKAIQEQVDTVNMGMGTIQVLSASHSRVYQKATEDGKQPNNELTFTDQPFSELSGSFPSADGASQIVYAKSKLNGWLTVGSIPVSDLTKEASRIFDATIIVLGIAFLIAIIVGLLIARMIGRPLAKLRNLMQEGAKGDLTIRTHAKPTDEIGQLGASFDTMLGKIAVLMNKTNQSATEVLVASKELSETSANTELAAREIAAATTDIAKGGEGLAAEAERGNELTANSLIQTDRLVDATLLMERLAQDVHRSSLAGGASMNSLMVRTQGAEQMIRSLTDRVGSLQESTRSIGKVLGILTSMTAQTNILSLNATIEAARAGASGKGFMVVADEIRKLAEQSKQSIDVVGQITSTIQSEIEETVHVLQEAHPLFLEQVDSAKEADLLFVQVGGQMDGFMDKLAEVKLSVQELKQSQQVLSGAMMNVSAVSEQSLATSEEVSSLSSEQLRISAGIVGLSEKLQSLAEILQQSLAPFKI